MSSRIRTLLKVIIFAATLSSGAAAPAAQTSAERFRDVLRRQAAFTPEEFAALERAGMVVKLLPSADKREVTFCGVLRLPGDPAMSLRAFKENLSEKNHGAIRGGGAFNSPPTLQDLASLTLEQDDVENMKGCAVGNCKVKLSAAMIGRLRGEVGWGSPEQVLQANGLFRSMLFDYVRDYLARGDAALIEYHNREKPLRLGEEQRSLLASLPYVNDSAPEFAAYLRDFPRAELPGVENAVHWSKIKVGFKPVVIVTHTAVYTRRHEDAQQILAATKQLYANHYFDSSLSLTLLTEAPGDGAAPATYLLYANRSRADTFGGMVGGLKRRLVEREVLDGLTTILKQTRHTARTRLLNQSVPTPETVNGAAWPRPRAVWFIVIALLIVAGTLLLRLNRRDSKRAAR